MVLVSKEEILTHNIGEGVWQAHQGMIGPGSVERAHCKAIESSEDTCAFQKQLCPWHEGSIQHSWYFM